MVPPPLCKSFRASRFVRALSCHSFGEFSFLPFLSHRTWDQYVAPHMFAAKVPVPSSRFHGAPLTGQSEMARHLRPCGPRCGGLRLSELQNVFAEGSICSETIGSSQASSCGTHFEGAALFVMLRPRGRTKSLSPGRPTCQGCISVQGHASHCRPLFDTRSVLQLPLSDSSSWGSHRQLQAIRPPRNK